MPHATVTPSTPATLAERSTAHAQGLYDPAREHDACGVGFVAHIKGQKAHDIVEQGLKILENLDHRGAVGADKLMGDGAGILIQIPDEFYRAEMAEQGDRTAAPGRVRRRHDLPAQGARVAAGLRCRNSSAPSRPKARCCSAGATCRSTPTCRCRRRCAPKEPVIRQIFIGRGPDVIVPDALERKLYVIRKTASSAIQALKLTHSREYYVPSMSCRTIIYKGLLLADQVGKYYQDLQDPRVVSALALVHQRFSTNTFPEWPLAHPYRMVAHNGEINTVKGNFNWMRAREGVMKSPVLGDDLKKLYPISFEGQSDTATFDNALELLDDERLLARPRGDDDDPRGLGAALGDGRAPPRLLRVPRRDDGAVGRPGRDGLHRRPPDRRHARPQRPAPGALHRHRRRPRRRWRPNPACCR